MSLIFLSIINGGPGLTHSQKYVDYKNGLRGCIHIYACLRESACSFVYVVKYIYSLLLSSSHTKIALQPLQKQLFMTQ